MKQAQSNRAWYRRGVFSQANCSRMRSGLQQAVDTYDVGLRNMECHGSQLVGQLVVIALRGVWFILTVPFRLVFRLVAWLGRITALLVGFSLMVVGMALWAGPFFWIGIPLFVSGLVLTLHCLE
jgi:hypothetical protein